MDQMITTEEALKLYYFATVADLELAGHIFNACFANDFSVYGTIACVYNAGRIHGIRIERRRRDAKAQRRSHDA